MLPLDGGDPALAEILADVDQALAEVDEAIPAPCYLRETPRVDVPLAEAWLAPRRALPLEKAVGQTAAALLEAYPPGIPLLLPGERITQGIVDAWTASGRDAATIVEVLDNA